MAEEVSKKEIPVSAPLKDVIEMVEARPELSQEEWEVTNKVIPWLKAQLRIEVRGELEVEYAKKNEEQLEELKRLNKQHIDESFAALKKAQEPLSQDELAKMLSQEYIEVPAQVRAIDPSDPKKKITRTFTICELPSAIEEKFYKLLKTALIPILQEREALEFKLDRGSLIEKIQTVLDASEGALELGAKLVAVILDPWGEDKTITKDWVRNNMSTQRQAAMIIAQFEANKYRDFFSQGFRSFLNQKTINGMN